MKSGKFSEFFVTFVVKKTMKPKNSDILPRTKFFTSLKETPEIFCIADDFCKVFYDAQMSKYTFKACFF